MLFKVVKTTQSGKSEYAIVPETWERDGTLYWPSKYTFRKLNIGHILDTGDQWTEMDCIVIKKGLESYQQAEMELKGGSLNPQQESSGTDDVPIGRHVKKKTNLNTLNEDCLNTSQSRSPDRSNSKGNPDPSLSTKDDNSTNKTPQASNNGPFLAKSNSDKDQPVFPLIVEISSECASSTNAETTDANFKNTSTCYKIDKPQFSKLPNITCDGAKVCMESQILENNKINKKLDELTAKVSTILENQTIMSLNQASLSNMFEEFMKQAHTARNLVPEISNAEFSIIETAEDLQRLENDLADPVFRQNLERRFSVLSGREDGKGTNVAYKLIDLMFSRQFMTRCSWSGGSRDDMRKVCFKMFRRTIEFFFSIVRASDSLYTLDDCENFFKLLLKNAKQRNLHMNIRQSKLKRRRSRMHRMYDERYGAGQGSDNDERETVQRLIENAIIIEET